MKKRSGCWIGWVRSAVSVMDTSSLCRPKAGPYPSSVTGEGAAALFGRLRHLHARRLGAPDQLARPLIGRLAVAHDRLAADEGRDIAIGELMQPLAAGRQVGDDPRVVEVELGIVDDVDVGTITRLQQAAILQPDELRRLTGQAVDHVLDAEPALLAVA